MILVIVLFSAPKILLAKVNSQNFAITKVRASFIDVRRKDQIIEFIGNAIVEKEDVSFLADKMIVYYYDKKDPNQPKGTADNKTDNNAYRDGSLKRIDAQNNVKIFNQEFVATGKTGVYDPQSKLFTLEKDVVFNNGTSVANGQKFIYNLVTKKGYLTGNTKPKSSAVGSNSKIDSHIDSDGRVVVIIGNDVTKKKDQGPKTKQEPTKDNSVKK